MGHTSDTLLNADGEVVVTLIDGWTLRSGDEHFTSGGYVRLCQPNGHEYIYWDSSEWKADPELVMGAIINSAAGLRVETHGGLNSCEATRLPDDS